MNRPGQGNPSPLTVTSPDLARGTFPREFTCDGANRPPRLQWSTPPSGTQQLAVELPGPDAPGGTFTHWLIYRMPAGITSLAAVPPGAAEGVNDFGRRGYGGPCPPRGASNTRSAKHHQARVLTPAAACRGPGHPGPGRPSSGPVLVEPVVAFLPFPARLVAEALHHAGAERVAVTIYGLALLAIRLLRSALDACARREHLFSQHGAGEELHTRRRLLPVSSGT